MNGSVAATMRATAPSLARYRLLGRFVESIVVEGRCCPSLSFASFFFMSESDRISANVR